MKKIIDYTLIVFALFIAVVFYFSFDLEDILWNKYEGSDIIAQMLEKDAEFVRSKEDWEDVLNEIDYVSVIPQSVIKTEVYSLAKWADHYAKRRNGTAWRRLDDVKKTSFDISADYSPYYIIELEDGSRILAQMNRGIAERIQKGECVPLPVGRKLGFLKSAKKLLAPICEEWGVDTDYVLYTIDDAWEADNADTIFLIKFAASAVLFFVLAVGLQLLFDKLASLVRKNG